MQPAECGKRRLAVPAPPAPGRAADRPPVGLGRSASSTAAAPAGTSAGEPARLMQPRVLPGNLTQLSRKGNSCARDLPAPLAWPWSGLGRLQVHRSRHPSAAAFVGAYNSLRLAAPCVRALSGSRRFLRPGFPRHLLQALTGAQGVALVASDLGARDHAALFLLLLLDVAL